ncbi:Uncharacterized protein QTN25_003012 [Entamoeba marina]
MLCVILCLVLTVSSFEINTISGHYNSELLSYVVTPHEVYPNVYDIKTTKLIYQLIFHTKTVDLYNEYNTNLGPLNITQNTSTITATSDQYSLEITSESIIITKLPSNIIIFDVTKNHYYYIWNMLYYCFVIIAFLCFFLIMKCGGEKYFAGALCPNVKED